MRVLVTGATPKGLGGAICLRLARDAVARGVVPQIAACGTGRSDSLDTLASELRQAGANVLPLADRAHCLDVDRTGHAGREAGTGEPTLTTAPMARA